jgi:hypothetical protein
MHRVAHPLDPSVVARAGGLAMGRVEAAPPGGSSGRASSTGPAGVSRSIASGSGASIISGMAKGVPSGKIPRAASTAIRPASSIA